jgi:4,5-DOPA dioxygenase extradiol
MNAPVVFVSHGSPELARATGHPWAEALHTFGRDLQARAILAISAHWWTPDLRITAAPQPGVLHDFSGFQEALYALDYPAAGDPARAAAVATALESAGFPTTLDTSRPLDHGVWAVLRHLRPVADLPVLQLSLPRWEPARLLEVGWALAPLRAEGIAILASGGLVHNLGRLAWDEPGDQPLPWAAEAEAWVLVATRAGDLEALTAHRTRWPHSRDAAPTTEHLDPLFVALGAAKGASPRDLFRGFQLGSLSLASLAWDA